MNGPLLVHINYFEQGQSLSRACQMARDSSVDGIEFRRKAFDFTGTDLEYLDKVSAALEKCPLAEVSFGGPGVNLMGADEKQRHEEIKSAEAFFRQAASRFPLRVVNAFAGDLRHPDTAVPMYEFWRHGSAVAREAQWISAIEGYRYLGSVAQELGFRFAFETHGHYLHDTLEATLRLVNEVNSPHVGLLWDHVNLSLFPQPPSFAEVIEGAGKKLFYVHFKNLLVPSSEFLAISSLSGGILNIRDQLAQLKASGYTGPFCLECPRPGDRERFLEEDVAYFRELLKEP